MQEQDVSLHPCSPCYPPPLVREREKGGKSESTYFGCCLQEGETNSAEEDTEWRHQLFSEHLYATAFHALPFPAEASFRLT